MVVNTPLDSAQNIGEMGETLSQLDVRPERSWLSSMRRSKFALAAGIVVLLMVLMALAAPWIVPHDPKFIDPSIRLLPPGPGHRFGTDDFGRDVLSRVMYGARVSLLIGASVTLISALIGSVLGLVSGYYQRFDTPIMRIMDGMMAFPSILLAIAIMASLGPSTRNVFIALTVVYVPTIARLVRGSTLVLKQQPFVESARSIGLRDHAILSRYIFANSLSPLIVQCTFVLAFAIISEASLSFLGAGVPPDEPSWGNMLRDGQKLIQRAWWMAIFPGIFLVITVLAFNILGDGLRDALDPRSRER
jgi:peptide/nickel transport system permease protein